MRMALPGSLYADTIYPLERETAAPGSPARLFLLVRRGSVITP